MSCSRLALVAAICGAISCAPLPSFDHGACGNAVIDPGEDCDTFPRYGSSCRAPGEPDACHLDCSRSEDGVRATCPTGWGCDADAICRRPTAEFEAPVAFEAGSNLTLASGDFDGDGRDDLLGREPLDDMQRTRIRFHYFNEAGQLGESRAFPKVMNTPVVAELFGDGRNDVLFSDPRLNLLHGSADRGFVPEAFGSYRVEGASLRMFQLYTREGAPVVAMSTLRGVAGLFIPDARIDSLRPVLRLTRGVDALVGDPVMGNVIEDDVESPCFDFVFAYRGTTAFSLADLCFRDGSGALAFRDEAVLTRVALEPAAAIDHAPLLADVDLDGHLDAMIGAGGKVYFAKGDGKTLATARPYILTHTDLDSMNPAATSVYERKAEELERMPLAVADLSADGAPDFVFPSSLRVSVPGSDAEAPIYRFDNEPFGAPWSEAKIADLNRDGRLDVIAASSGRLDLDFFNGTNSEHLPHVSISTQAPAVGLSIGDYDGDGVDDVAFAEQAEAADQINDLMMAFGNASGAPSAPKRVARVRGVEQLQTLRTPSISNLMVCSLDRRGAPPTGMLMLFDGSADRIPAAPYELTNFSSTGSLGGRAVFGMTAGPFVAPGSRDVFALATPNENVPIEDRAWEFWLVPSIDTGRAVAAVLPAKFPSTLAPYVEVDDEERYMRVATGGADLDGDGVYEALFAIPTADERRCGIVTLGDRDNHFSEPRKIELDFPCLQPLLEVADADDDGAPEIVLLVGANGSAERSLLVLWNDGFGNFSSSDFSVVNEAFDAPRQFALLPSSIVRRFTIAYVTADAVKSSSILRQSRDFSPPVVIATARGGSGIASGDINGDGVLDLALAQANSIAVLKAHLEAQ